MGDHGRRVVGLARLSGVCALSAPSPPRQWVYPDSMQRRSWQVPLALFAALAVGTSVLSFAMLAHARGGSGGAVHVRGYIRKDGTYVAPHYRSAPDGSLQNNWSTKGNVNPYTGEEGTLVTPPVPASRRAAEPLAPRLTVPPYRPAAQPLAPPVTVPPYKPAADPLAEPTTPPTPPEDEPVPRRHKAAAAAPSMTRRQASDLDRVNAAERRRNLNLCLHSGEAFCKREMLTPAEQEQFEKAERRRNLNLCLHSGEAFCNREMLTPAAQEKPQPTEARSRR